MEIKGKRVYSKLKYESGVHRVQRVPRTEAQGRVHTSTATVAIMPEVSPHNSSKPFLPAITFQQGFILVTKPVASSKLMQQLEIV